MRKKRPQTKAKYQLGQLFTAFFSFQELLLECHFMSQPIDKAWAITHCCQGTPLLNNSNVSADLSAWLGRSCVSRLYTEKWNRVQCLTKILAHCLEANNMVASARFTCDLRRCSVTSAWKARSSTHSCVSSFVVFSFLHSFILKDFSAELQHDIKEPEKALQHI